MASVQRSVLRGPPGGGPSGVFRAGLGTVRSPRAPGRASASRWSTGGPVRCPLRRLRRACRFGPPSTRDGPGATGSGAAPAKRSPGSPITAVTPEPGVAVSETPIPCRAASRATTWKPRRWATDRSISGGSASSEFAAARSSGGIPTPQSSTVTSCPPGRARSGRTRIVTTVSGGE
ncbi:hypothetical protein BJF78_20980 [Pseudonocardia sp. CNS-139]|nr:hypothetical protein BJF78_20980 [Pseudonocardia sp. CNS-139]